MVQPVSFARSILCPVLIGRTPLVDALQHLIDDVAGGSGRVALLAGEAGVGKTRLIAEAKAYAAERGFALLAGACFPQDRASPYAVLLELLRARFAGQPPEARTATVGAFARELFPLLPELIPPPTDLPRLPALEPEQERRRLLAAFSHCLLDQTAGRPALVVVEDLHWCDDASLDGLLHLARQAVARPLLLLGTYRSDEVDLRLRAWLAQLDRERLGEELAVSPLAREEVAAMLRAIVGQERLVSGELLDAVQVLAEGNPFYVEELLKALVASGDLRYREGTWEGADRPVAEWRLPRSLQDAVQRRVAQLSPAAREVLSLAAVIGRRFDFRLLQHLARLDERALLTLIKELIAAQLVVEESRDEFAFRHALTRQAITAELLERERVILHRVVGEAVEAIYPEVREPHLSDLAYHFAEAGVWEKALAYAQRAGERARRLYAPRAAVEELSRASLAARHLAAAQPVPAPRLADLYQARGEAYETLGDFEHALADYESVLTLARDAGDHQWEWQGLLDLGRLWAGRDLALTGDYYQRALELARSLDEPRLIAHTLNRLGHWRVNAVKPREALALHKEALAIFEGLGDRPGVATTLDLLGTASFFSGELVGIVRYSERAATLFRELDDRQGLSHSLAMLSHRGGSYLFGTMTSDAAEVAVGLRDGERALELARSIAWPAGEAFALFNLAAALGLQGEYTRALELAERALQIATEIEQLEMQIGAHWTLGHLYLELRALAKARHHFQRAVGLARQIRSTLWEQQATGCLAWTHVIGRELDRVAALLGPLPETDRPVESLGERWINFGHLHLALARRQPALALRLVDRASPLGLDGTRPIESPRPALARAAALTGLGRYDEAEAVLRTVREAAHRQGARPLLWRAQLGLGQVYHAQGREDAARREFSAARAIIEDLATGLLDTSLRAGFLETATAELPRAYRLSPHRTTATRFGGLTAREREVAALIAQGKSNRDLAEALVLGERTVEYHVSNILNKLGVASRLEIATWAVQQGLVDPAP